MSTINNNINSNLTSGVTTNTSTSGASTDDIGGWYEAMAKAWGSTLDDQASRITSLSDAVAGGMDNPSTMTLLTTESLRMQFLANNASTATSSVGQALESLARKQ